MDFIMACMFVGHMFVQIITIIVKVVVAIPATIDSIIKFGDFSLVMDEISMDLDLSFSMDSLGIGALDSIDLWLNFDWISVSIGGLGG